MLPPAFCRPLITHYEHLVTELRKTPQVIEVVQALALADIGEDGFGLQQQPDAFRPMHDVPKHYTLCLYVARLPDGRVCIGICFHVGGRLVDLSGYPKDLLAALASKQQGHHPLCRLASDERLCGLLA